MIRPLSDRIGAFILANGVAAFAVAAITLLFVWVCSVNAPGNAGQSGALSGGFVLGLFAGLYALLLSFPVFLAGLIVVGIPTWWVLHRTGRAGPWTFPLVSALESVLAGVILFRIIAPGSEVMALLLAVPGGLAGWVLWRVGYSPVRRRPARPS